MPKQHKAPPASCLMEATKRQPGCQMVAKKKDVFNYKIIIRMEDLLKKRYELASIAMPHYLGKSEDPVEVAKQSLLMADIILEEMIKSNHEFLHFITIEEQESKKDFLKQLQS